MRLAQRVNPERLPGVALVGAEDCLGAALETGALLLSVVSSQLLRALADASGHAGYRLAGVPQIRNLDGWKELDVPVGTRRFGAAVQRLSSGGKSVSMRVGRQVEA